MATYYYFSTPYGAKAPKLHRIEGTKHGKDRVKVARRVPGLGYGSLISAGNLNSTPELALATAQVRATFKMKDASERLKQAMAEYNALVPGMTPTEEK